MAPKVPLRSFPAQFLRHERYTEHGYDGLIDRRRGKRGKRVPLAEVEQVLGLYREKY
jgi:hypothetical protein